MLVIAKVINFFKSLNPIENFKRRYNYARCYITRDESEKVEKGKCFGKAFCVYNYHYACYYCPYNKDYKMAKKVFDSNFVNDDK